MLTDLVIFKKNVIIIFEKEEKLMVRLIILILVVAIGSWAYHSFAPESFTKESMEEAIKKEKTINTVQQSREKRFKEAEDVMNSY